ncbi:insulinase family protein [Alteromonas genovensis]|uniref:Insulinase family protein n=1 Tax=Alteromonas genovensis TaxID=471225 RepID=A0A6N9TI27_9ALTE|nr:pitrilysin family protein [Alteromonas genovensis]NDW15735.1 insulinase family protein [Alteromonas genovensis]
MSVFKHITRQFSKKCLSIVAITLVGISPVVANDDIDISYEKFTIDNGLTVIVHEDRKAPVVAVAVWYKVGSKDEPEGKSGFAHLFEHLMFNGTENYDDEWFGPLQEAGATGLNGTTNFDRTNYFQTVPTPALDRILWMESDRMGHLLGAVTQEKLDEQRGVVQNEKRQREDQPYGAFLGHAVKALFPNEHPYSHNVIGSMDDLNSASLDDVKSWFNKYYGPNNAILVLSGDINAEEAKPMVNKYFGDIEPGPSLAKWQSWIPSRSANTREIIQDKVPQTRISRLWVSPENKSAKATDLLIAASVLGDGKNSRMYKELVYDQQIATNASVFNYELQIASIFGLSVDVAAGEDVEKVEREMDKIIQEFLRKGPTKDEVKLVSTKRRASIIRGLEEVGGFGGKADRLATGEFIAGDPTYFKTELKELANATPKKIKAAAKEWLGDGWHQITFVPFEEHAASGEGVDRSSGLPDIAAETQLTFPEVTQTTLSNGINVVFAKRSTVPLINVAVQFDAGYAADAGGKLGLASFATGMLDEGAGRYDALELAAELEQLGTNLNSGSNLDTTTVRMSMLKENMEESLALFGDILKDPTFDKEEIERQRTLILSNIAQQMTRPISIALTLLPPLIYGDDHAYGIPFTGLGTAPDVTSITRSDLIDFKNTWLRPDNATIFVVGDTTLDDIKPTLEKEFGKWKVSGEKGTKQIAEAQLPEKGRAIIIDRPGSQQSLILAAHLAPPTGVENNIAINAMNETLGGAFTARVNMNLREDKGWAYGAYTFLQEARGQRPYMVYAPVQTDKTGASLEELKKELNGYLGDNPPTEMELNRARLDQVRSLPGQYETAGAVLGSLLSSSRFNREFNYPESLVEKYNGLTLDDLNSAAKQVVQPGKLTWLIIGDAEKIKAEVEAADIGPVTVQDMSSL